jgi:mRNA interferase RelE/StbE
VTYQLLVKEGADDELADLPPDVRARVMRRIRALALDPRPAGSRPLSGDLRGFYRIRVGDYRIGYLIDDSVPKVVIWAVGPRRGFYERLARRR